METNTTTKYSMIETQFQQVLQQPTKRKLRFIYGDEPKGVIEKPKGKFKVKQFNTHTKTDSIIYDKLNKENYITKEVEVECEIEEDPSFLEGSEDYVRSLIKKVQTQYKDPETVHIRIVRRQKQTVWNGLKNTKRAKKAIDKPNLQKEQLIKKEYYTLRSSKQIPFTSSFINTTDIPYIDEETSSNDSRNNSFCFSNKTLLESKELVNNKEKLNYFIENHIILNDDNQFSSSDINKFLNNKGKYFF
jgi:hypothetical protein